MEAPAVSQFTTELLQDQRLYTAPAKQGMMASVSIGKETLLRRPLRVYKVYHLKAIHDMRRKMNRKKVVNDS